MQTSTTKKFDTWSSQHHTPHKAVAANQSFQLSDTNADTANPETQKARDKQVKKNLKLK